MASLLPLHVKLGDFGISKRVQNNDTELRTYCGTAAYMAPEVYPTNDSEPPKYTNAVDIWSLGCVVHKILTGQTPFTTTEFWRYADGLSEFPLQHLKAKRISVSGARFINRLMKVHAGSRLTAEQARRDKWLNKDDVETDWDYIEVESAGSD